MILASKETITVDTTTEPENNDTIEENTEPEEQEEEITQMERIIEMNPITTCLGYTFKDGALKGILPETARMLTTLFPILTVNEVGQNVTLEEFFMNDNKIYFSFTDSYTENDKLVSVTRYFVQESGVVTEIEAADFPSEPNINTDSARLVATMGDFKFETYEWENQTYNRLMRGDKIISVANNFDSAVLTDAGIIFSQPETLSRPAGLWFCGTDAVAPVQIDEYYHIWN